MYSDTHFHFHYLVEQFGTPWGAGLLASLAERDCFFALDIGTKSDDLATRMALAKDCLGQIADQEVRDRACGMLWFSAGIWPDEDAIRGRKEQLAELERQIARAQAAGSLFPGRLAAVGECGLDHHWNPAGADKRSGEGWDDGLFQAESEMFMMQLELAHRLSLPVIVHSRDAFDGTLACLDEVGYHRGIIHCHSYGIDEARAFLDRGWYIAFGGAITYNKKAKLEAIKELLRFVPADRFLCETDAPYLAPVPLRGTVNTPVNIELVYNFAAEVRGQSPKELSNLVDENIKTLFPLY